MRKSKEIDHIFFVFSNQTLLEVEERGIEYLNELLECNITSHVVENQDDFNVLSDERSLIIVDEADYFFLDKRIFPSQGRVLALSATSMAGITSTEQTLMMQGWGLTVVDIGLESIDEKKVIEVDTVEEFFTATNGMPRIVFGDVDQMPETPRFTVDVGDERIYKMKPTDTFVQTKEWLMRGLDYGTEEPQGVAVLIAKSFASTRALQQALGRVGRYGAKFKRFQLSDIDGVD